MVTAQYAVKLWRRSPAWNDRTAFYRSELSGSRTDTTPSLSLVSHITVVIQDCKMTRATAKSHTTTTFQFYSQLIQIPFINCLNHTGKKKKKKKEKQQQQKIPTNNRQLNFISAFRFLEKSSFRKVALLIWLLLYTVWNFHTFFLALWGGMVMLAVCGFSRCLCQRNGSTRMMCLSLTLAWPSTSGMETAATRMNASRSDQNLYGIINVLIKLICVCVGLLFCFLFNYRVFWLSLQKPVDVHVCLITGYAVRTGVEFRAQWSSEDGSVGGGFHWWSG